MKDTVDSQLKAEIDEIMKKVKTILKNIENHDPFKEKATDENQDLSN